jgi:hypothetical protein
VNRLKWIALGLAGIAVFVGVVILVETLVASSVPIVAGQGRRGYWAEAIQAVSTVVVMAATTVYAVITYQMVQAMRQQTVTMSASLTRTHVIELSRFLMGSWLNPHLVLKASVLPDSQSTVDKIAEQIEAVERVTATTLQLVSFSSACPPDILLRIKPVTDASYHAMAMVGLVRKSISQAARSAMKGDLPALEDLFRRMYGRRTGGLDEGSTAEPPGASRALDPSWDEVRDEYLLHVRDGAPGKPEWDDIISAKWFHELLVPWGELITACTYYLHPERPLGTVRPHLLNPPTDQPTDH